MLPEKIQDYIGSHALASPKKNMQLNQHNGPENFLTNIRTIFDHAAPPKVNIISDVRLPISRSSTDTTTSMSFIEPIEELQLTQPFTMDIDSIRRSMNEGKENEEIITAALKEQRIPDNDLQILSEKTLAAYNVQKKKTPMTTLPGAKSFVQSLQENNVAFCFCTNASKEKTEKQLNKTFNQIFTVFGKCNKGKGEKSQVTARMLRNQYLNKKLIVIGNELNDFKLSQDLQTICDETTCILVGDRSKLTASNIDTPKDLSDFSFAAHDYENGFDAAKKLIEKHGADKVAVIMDVHGTVLDTAELLKRVATDVIAQHYDPLN